MKFYLMILAGMVTCFNLALVQTAQGQNIVKRYKYWFNDIPSDAQTVTLSNPQSIAEIELDLNVESIAEGEALLNVQFQDLNGLWTPVFTQPFTNILSPKLEFTASKKVACIGEAINFINQSKYGENYIWKITKGDKKWELKGENPQFTFSELGSYSVELIGNRIENGREANLMMSDFITITAPKEASIMPLESNVICGKQNTLTLFASHPESNQKYKWLKDGKVLQNTDTEKLSVQEKGKYQLIQADPNGCWDTSAVQEVYFLSAEVLADDQIIMCPSTPETILAKNSDVPQGTIYEWYKDGEKLSNQSTSLILAEEGMYQLRLKYLQTGCELSSKIVEAKILSADLKDAGQTQKFCIGKNYCIKAQKTYSNALYQWYINNTLIDGAVYPEYCAQKTGYYSLHTTLAGKCEVVSNQSVRVLSNPVITRRNDSLMVEGDFACIQWYVNGQKLLNATTPLIVVHFDGVFTVKVCDACDTNAESDSYEYQYTDRPYLKNQNIGIYPNPASEVIYLQLSERQISGYQITNALGQLVQQSNEVTQNQINIQNLDTGIYWLTIKVAGNTYQSKFIKN